MQQALLGGGCFWCVEAVFLQLQGVEKVVSGYAGGHTVNPSYDDICRGDTHHAEVILIEAQVRLPRQAAASRQLNNVWKYDGCTPGTIPIHLLYLNL